MVNILQKEFNHDVLKRFLLIALPVIALLLGLGASHYYYSGKKLERIKIETVETLNVNLAQGVMVSHLQSITSDLMFLTQLNELQRLLAGIDERQKGALASELMAFISKKGLYDQIRYLNTQGVEIVRINYNNGKPSISPPSRLQNKSARYYFREAIKLKQGEVYVSPFDLNMENGRIERPYKPVIRLATPVYGSNGKKKGIIVINYLGAKLISRFKQATVNIADHVSLVNADGYWLSSTRPENEWGFMLKHGRSFSKDHPSVWEQIAVSDNGHFYNADGLYTYATIDPVAVITGLASRNSTLSWKVISHKPPSSLMVSPGAYFRKNLMIYGTTGMLLILACFLLAWAWVRNDLVKERNEYERHFRATLENIQLAALSMDRAGLITFCNDCLLTQTGWSQQGIIGKSFIDIFIPPEDRAATINMLSEAQTKNSLPATLENRIQTCDGKILLYAWNITPTFDTEGNIATVTYIGEDITEQRHSEEQLRKLSRAVEQSPNPVIITNTKGIIEYVNPRFTQLTGYTAEEAIGHRPSILKSGETTQDEYDKLWETIRRGKEWRGLFHNRKKSGELYWEYTAISPIRNPAGEITHFLAVKEDITERKRLEKEVEARKQELAHAKGLAVVGRMANMIAHDLRNPLSSVKMALQILGKRTYEKGDDRIWINESRELKQIALDQVRYMEEILADLLKFSRPDALKPEWLNVDKLLDITISSNQKAIKEHKAKVITDYQPQLPTIHGDATKLRQVFNNLIMNALQATENVDRKPEIYIRTRLELDEHMPKIRVELSDNGLGVDSDLSDKLFEPFYTTRAKGTGLGLAIVKRIVEQHHGSINLDPVSNGGTCATVILPTSPVQ